MLFLDQFLGIMLYYSLHKEPQVLIKKPTIGYLNKTKFIDENNKCYKSSVQKKIRQIVFVAVALPILFAIAWMVYLSKTEAYTLDVNYGNVLHNMLFGRI